MTSKKEMAVKKFQDAMQAVSAAGEDRINFCLSFVRGYMDGAGETEMLHEWDDACMRIKLSSGEQIH